MVVTLQIPEPLYKRLQNIAEPFVDTPITVIEKCVEIYERRAISASVATVTDRPAGGYGSKTFDPSHPPDLFHTRARGTFGTMPFKNWNELVRVAHIAAFAKSGSFDELRHITNAQVTQGVRSDSGYKYVKEIDLSIQGLDANHAWQCALRLAKYLGEPLRAMIEWRNNPRAANPGVAGTLEFIP